MESDSIFFQFLLIHTDQANSQKMDFFDKPFRPPSGEAGQPKKNLGGLMTLKLRSKVKLDIRIIVLHHLQPGF